MPVDLAVWAGHAGLDVRLSAVAINAEYTPAEYSGLNLGVGIGFR